jgi:hypothetical protein
MISGPSASRARGRRKDLTSMRPSRDVPLTRTDFRRQPLVRWTPVPWRLSQQHRHLWTDQPGSHPPLLRTPPAQAAPCRPGRGFVLFGSTDISDAHERRAQAGTAVSDMFTDSEPIDRHACILARRGGLARYAGLCTNRCHKAIGKAAIAHVQGSNRPSDPLGEAVTPYDATLARTFANEI